MAEKKIKKSAKAKLKEAKPKKKTGPPPITPNSPEIMAFLAALSKNPSLRGASKDSGISHQTIYNLFDRHPEFQDTFAAALKAGMEANGLTNIRERQKFPMEIFDAFFGFLAQWPNITKACDLMGVCRATVLQRRKNDPEFKAKFDEAMELGKEAMEDYGYEFAKENPTIYIFMMKGLFPEKYRERYESKVDASDRLVSLLKEIDGRGVTRPKTDG